MRIFTLIHGRHEVTKAWFWHIEYLRKVCKIKFNISVCYSDESDLELIKNFCTKDDQVIQAPNNPVSYKWRTLVSSMLKNTKDKKFIQTGSDDFMTPLLLDTLSKQKEDYVGIDRCYIYSPERNKAVEWQFKSQSNKLIGAARLFSRKALEQVDIFDFKADKGLDNLSENKLYFAGIKPKLIQFDSPQVVDVKIESENIHSFDEFENCKPVSVDLVKEILSVTFS